MSLTNEDIHWYTLAYYDMEIIESVDSSPTYPLLVHKVELIATRS